jgi:hypothetical protein
MIIYTTMPLELVFADYEKVEKQKIQEIDMGGGVKMMVEPMGDYQGKIVRIISPNPHDYMNPRFAPGQTISFRPTLP